MRDHKSLTTTIAISLAVLFSPGCRAVSGVFSLLDVRCLPSTSAGFDGFEGSDSLKLDLAIADAAGAHGVSEELIRAIIETESSFDARAMSPSGACGLMQLMPVTQRRFGVADCFNVRENIAAGTRLLKTLLTRYQGSLSLSVAAYNAGETAVARHGGIPPYRQTRAYVRRVQALMKTPERES